MATIRCPKCKEVIDDSYTICPICDTNFKKYKKGRRLKTTFALIISIIVVISTLFSCLNSISFKSFHKEVKVKDYYEKLEERLLAYNIDNSFFEAKTKFIYKYRYLNEFKFDYINATKTYNYTTNTIFTEYKDFFCEDGQIGRSEQGLEFKYDEEYNTYYRFDLKDDSYTTKGDIKSEYEENINIREILRLNYYALMYVYDIDREVYDTGYRFYIDKDVFTMYTHSSLYSDKFQVVFGNNTIETTYKVKLKKSSYRKGYEAYNCKVTLK